MQGLALCAPETLASHRSFLYSYALAKLRQPSAAEELVQETLLAAVEGQAGFKGESKLRTWLTGILKHKIIDWHRSEARNPARASPRPPADPDDQYEDTCDALFDSAGNWVNPPSAWPNPVPVDAFVLNVWLCVARHVIHDTEEAGRLLLTHWKPFCLAVRGEISRKPRSFKRLRPDDG
jgi:RNA polymerase sigma factor (sigma-70 family)